MHVFAILGDPVRFRIVEILASGSHTAGELAAAVGGDTGVSRTAVSHHLRILRDAGFVTVRKDENVREYRLHWDALESVDRILLDLFDKWDRRSGWPYVTDPLVVPPRRHRLQERRARPQRSDDVEPLAVAKRAWWDWEDEDPPD
ncbi:MAG: metalloregulator ArsR/SmtB family transcription factor [Pseudolysinimonas sp.]